MPCFIEILVVSSRPATWTRNLIPDASLMSIMSLCLFSIEIKEITFI